MAAPPYVYTQYVVVRSSDSTAEIQVACQKLNELATQGYVLLTHSSTAGTFVWTMGK